MAIIEVEKLTKKFGKLTAVDRVSFQVKEGEIFGFLGPNGAGKSTTISMLSTIIRPTSGTASINGFDIVKNKNEVRKSIGLIFQDPSLDDRLTAEENLRLHSELYGVSRADYKNRLNEVLKLVELAERKKDIVKTFSGGMKRRLEIARGLIHFPKVLFLDEPTLGLDPQTRLHIWDYIMRLKRERAMTIFMTTHYMVEAEYCDRIAVIDQGKIIALDSPTKLKRMLGGDVITLKSPNLNLLEKEIKDKLKLDGKILTDGLQIEVKNGAEFMPELFKKISVKIDSAEVRKPTLEDVFIYLTGRKIREDGAENNSKSRMGFMRR